MAKVSVIVPIYNSEQYLRQTLDSIVKQTMPDLEIILVDDGSTDKSAQIINEYARNDKRIVSLYHSNCGLGKTINAGLNIACGEYIGIVEADDFIALDMYENLYKIAKKYNSDIVKSAYFDNLQSKEEQRVLKIEWDKNIPQDKCFNIKDCGLFLRYHPSVWSCIYKKEFLNNNAVRYPELSGASWADNPFQVKTMCLAQKINYTSNAYYYYRRIYKCDSEALSDYKIPFERAFEIHDWLKKNKIYDKEILVNLYLRELSYIKIVLGMKKNIDIADCLSLIKRLLGEMNADYIFNSKTIKEKDKKLFSRLLKNPLYVRKSILMTNARKNLISFRYNKNEKRIVFLGKTIFKQSKEMQI